MTSHVCHKNDDERHKNNDVIKTLHKRKNIKEGVGQFFTDRIEEVK